MDNRNKQLTSSIVTGERNLAMWARRLELVERRGVPTQWSYSECNLMLKSIAEHLDDLETEYYMLNGKRWSGKNE